MALFEVSMQHSEESLYALSHMQYDLFCTRNFIVRSLLSLCLIALGVWFFSRFWGILLLAYGCYLMTSAYSASNYTVRKLLEQIKSSGKGFPSSRYRFEENQIGITYHPGQEDEEELEPVAYDKLIKLGEDAKYFFLFPNARGGYCIPKASLGGDVKAFKDFVERKSGQRFYRRRPTPLQRLREWLRRREQEPVHL